MASFGFVFEAEYRGDGLRAYTDEYDEESGTWTRTYYLYDGGNAVAELVTSGNLKFTNVFAPDGLVCRRSAAGTTGYYLFDH